MDFAYSPEQEVFRQSLRRFLDLNSSSAEVRRWMETSTGVDPRVWAQMAEELGLQGIAIPEQYGGQGFGFLELGIVMEEMGRRLLCSPFFSSVCLASNALLNAGTEDQKKAQLPGLASGAQTATLALVDEGGSWNAAGIEMVARPDGKGFRLTGVKTPVLDGETAGSVIVAARLEGTAGRDGLTLVHVRGDAEGLRTSPLEAFDLTRKQARLEFRNVRGEALGQPGQAAEALDLTLDQAAAMLAAESTGGAEQALLDSVEYAKQRVQFARPIGSFQAIKHKCAEVMLEVECAKVASRWASWVAQETPEDLAEAASVAKSLAGDAYSRATQENIQIHGGIGFTWEADPHLYFKRAVTNDTLLGDAVAHRARLADGLGI